MGFSMSWVAFKRLDKKEVLRRTGLHETGEKSTMVPTREAPFAFCAFARGWSTIFSADYRYASAAGLGHLSMGTQVLGCQIEEHMMFSAAAFFADGLSMWQLSHDAQKSLFDLESSGALPTQYGPIRDELMQQQKQSRGGPFATDFIWDVPVALAYALTGYRHDVTTCAWGVPTYERLEVVR